MCYPGRLCEMITSVFCPWLQWTSVEDGAVLGWFRVSCVHHDDHGNAEVDPQSVDHGEAEAHQDGQVEAGRAALWMGCSNRKQY